MATIRELYHTDITDKSKQELVKFSKWFNEKHGSWPSVIGGWAVWSYHKDGFGSRDVDLVLPTDDWIENVLKKEYFPHNGFRPYRHLADFLGEKHYGKLIDPEQPDGDIIFFDLLSGSKPRDDPEELGVYVDWNWVINDYKETVSVDDAMVFVPEVELLLTLKMIGALARIRDLSFAKDRSYFEGKISKDYYDIANLTIYVKIDKEKLAKHVENTKLSKDLIKEFLAGYRGKPDILGETKASFSIIEKPFLDILDLKKFF